MDTNSYQLSPTPLLLSSGPFGFDRERYELYSDKMLDITLVGAPRTPENASDSTQPASFQLYHLMRLQHPGSGELHTQRRKVDDAS